MIKKILNFKFVIRNYNKGMTYVELIVVLSIFSVLSAVTIFNYKQFQLKVDIKNLAHDITLKIVEAQKSATSGKLAPIGQQPSNPLTWKPSYGLYFDLTTDNKTFYYFVDSNQSKSFNFPTPFSCPSGECLEPVSITKGNYISQIEVIHTCSPTPCTPLPPTLIPNDLHITFTRPNSGATFTSSTALSAVDHIGITVSSASTPAVTSTISIYPSGRIELN